MVVVAFLNLAKRQNVNTNFQPPKSLQDKLLYIWKKV